jgi:hypothetical protein
LSLLAAQLIYLGEPVVNGLIPSGHSRALAGLLEDDELRSAFIGVLREEDPT